MPLWSRVLKEATPSRGERVVPLRPLKLVPPRPLLPDDPEVAAPTAAAVTGKAREEAAAILDQARREAAAIKKAALQERQQVLDEARAAGADRGYQEGLARAGEEAGRIRQEAEGTREEARRVLVEARKAYRETLIAAEGEIIELALAVAAKIIGREIELRPDVVVEIARQAIRQVAEGQHYIIYTAPETAEVIRRGRAELLAEAAPGARLQVIADPAFTPGGCRVETENGFVDASVESQMEELKNILRADAHATHTAPPEDETGAASSRGFPTPDFQPPTSVLAGGRP